MNYNPPSFRKPQQYDIPASIDGIFDQYMQLQAQKQGAALQDITLRERYNGTNPLTDLKTDEQRSRAFAGPTITPATPAMPNQDFSRQMAQPYGAPMLGQGQDPRLAAQNMMGAPTPAVPEHIQFSNDIHEANIQRAIQTRKQGASMDARGKQADYAKTLSETDENMAQAEKLRRTPAEGGAPRTVNIKGVDYIETMTAQGLPHYQPIPERVPNQNEFVARGFADKATEGNRALETLFSKGFDGTSMSAGIQSYLPNRMQSADVQAIENAKKLFVNAVARRESGATIKDDEMARYNATYFPQDGDDPQTLVQKRRNRELAIAGLEAEARRIPTSAKPGGDGGAGGGKIRVTNGSETRLIDPSDEAAAAKDGYARAK